MRSLEDQRRRAQAERSGDGTAEASQQSRWAGYRRAIIRAELTRGEWHLLNGPQAVQPWPFAGAVFVITAHNPHGSIQPAAVNDEQQTRLAADLAKVGAGMMRAVGGSSDGRHEEASFLAWDIAEDEARRIAAAYGQDAIFELTDDTVAIVDAISGERERHPR